MSWDDFLKSKEWKEIVETIEIRKNMILNDLSDPEKTVDIKTIAVFQGELKSCNWFLTLPNLILQEKIDEQKTADHSV